LKTTLTKRGQTVVPAPLRRRYGMDRGTTLEWIDTGEGIRVIPLPADLLAALRGAAKGEHLWSRLRDARQGDRKREKRR
jgi:bifunctional DNA-binding transcriptional regulator/antitoxin component of YhaV-PrlF toxin-antitoxin module